ncbi:alkene reductase [Shimia sp. CNT1-13L.2]|uniref:alkene reductase n=1 Tax=Shimia sp. CNT1-13L.2 TaxID=2959663 RepID=UPI0020CDDBD3|nr:alkene reductase [Shimia sp. CNT1-13L.2]MCP9483598.1 alkene reductase [Shimia sp. CNT1-13L.2]
MTRKIFSPYELGKLKLANRIAMAPMTRSRTSQPGDVPNEIMATYYSQRANAGLIVSEGTPISAVGRGYSLTPGIYTPEHIAGWRKTTDAVHQAGSAMFVQLWHVGRRSHSVISGETPVSASALKDPDKVFGPRPDGEYDMIETETPRAMTLEDIQNTIADYVQAAHNAIEAGFDGVEIHAAHGYLLESFLRLASNQRDDDYGGSQENRMRFLLEVLSAVSDAIGAHRVAVRLSPFVIEGFADPDPEIVEITLKILEKLSPMGLAYVHFSEHISRFETVPESFRIAARAAYPNPIMVAGKLTLEGAEDLLEKGYADMVAFGTPYVTNPDLVQRFKNGWPLTDFDADARLTLYGGGSEGYTDYAPYDPSVSERSGAPELVG